MFGTNYAYPTNPSFNGGGLPHRDEGRRSSSLCGLSLAMEDGQ